MRDLPRSARWILVGFLCACSSGEKRDVKVEAPAIASQSGQNAGALYQSSWAQFVARQPESLQQLIKANPDKGWVKLYERDYDAAEAAFRGASTPVEKIGLGRAHLGEAELFQAAYTLAVDIEQRYLALWEENAGRLQKSDHHDFIAGLMALRAGQHPQALSRLQQFRKSPAATSSSVGAIAAVLEGVALQETGNATGAERGWKDPSIARDPNAAAMLMAIRTAPAGGSGARFPTPTTAYGQRNLMWAQLRAGAIDAAMETAANLDPRAADYEEDVLLPDGPVRRRFYDPQLLRTLAQLNAQLALSALSDAPASVGLYRARAEMILERAPAPVTGLSSQVDVETLPAFLFSDHPTPGDMARAAARLSGPSTPGTGGLIGAFLADLGPIPAAPAEGRDTREAVVLAQSYEDAARKVINGSGNEEGKGAVLGLKLVDGDVSLALRERAAAYVDQGRLIEALFLLEHTLDKDNNRLGYLNDPMLLIGITQVYCALGRYREALTYFCLLYTSDAADE